MKRRRRQKNGMAAVAAFLLCAFLLAGCGSGMQPESVGVSALTAEGALPEQPSAGAEIALITTEADYDSVFVQNAWTTISRVAGEAARTSGVYKTDAEDDDAALYALEMAARGGAGLAVLAGDALVKAVPQAQVLYPDLDFIFLGMPYGLDVKSNGVLLQFSPEQGGWLAGYAAMYEKKGNIGFVQDTEDEIAMRYALGFLLGADAAAADRGAEKASLRAYPIKLDEDEEKWEAQFADLYMEGLAMEVAMVSEEAYAPAALAAAEDMGRQVVGPGGCLDEKSLSVLVEITSDPRHVLEQLLNSWLEERFPGGTVVEGRVTDGDVGLDIENSRLVRLTEQRYEQVLDRFRLGTQASQIAVRLAHGRGNTLPLPEELGLEYIVVGLPEAEEIPGGGSAVSASQSGAAESGPEHEPANQPESEEPAVSTQEPESKADTATSAPATEPENPGSEEPVSASGAM